MHLFLKLFILVKHTTCFKRSFCPSSGAQDCIYSNRPISNVQSWAPDDGQKDRSEHVECFTRINNLRNRCIWLVVLQEYITMHRPVNVKFVYILSMQSLMMYKTWLSGCHTICTLWYGPNSGRGSPSLRCVQQFLKRVNDGTLATYLAYGPLNVCP
jgi:hypothetical protein